MKPLLPLVCPLLLLSSCHSVPPPSAAVPSRSLILLTSEQAKQHGLQPRSREPADTSPAAAPINASAVAIPADLKAYAVGRTVDPRDPALLHEAHVVYRQETTPQWRLQAPTDQRILIGPQLTEGRQDAQPLLTKELTAFLNEQRRDTQANQAAVAALLQAVERLAQQQRALADRGHGPDTAGQSEAAGQEGSGLPGAADLDLEKKVN